jgi:hypothetical protein
MQSSFIRGASSARGSGTPGHSSERRGHAEAAPRLHTRRRGCHSVKRVGQRLASVWSSSSEATRQPLSVSLDGTGFTDFLQPVHLQVPDYILHVRQCLLEALK